MPSSRSVLHNRATKANGFNPCPINRVPRVESVCKDSVDLDVKLGQFPRTRIAEGKRDGGRRRKANVNLRFNPCARGRFKNERNIYLHAVARMCIFAQILFRDESTSNY